MITRKLIPGIILVIFCFVGIIPALAQDVTQLARLHVRLWPEYDNPEMLVIYDLTLPAGTRLPAALSLRIPASSGGPLAVASRQPDGNMVNLQYDPPVKQGDWLVINFDATTLESRLEYYDPLNKSDGARQYDYVWPGDYAVTDFSVEAQQPVGASDVSFSPSLGSPVTGSDGMNYYISETLSLTEGQEYRLTMNYSKNDDSLSADALSVEPVQPIETSTTVDSLTSVLPWLLFGLGLLLIGGAAIWYFRSGRTTLSSRKKPARNRRKSAGKGMNLTTTSSEEGAIYCHQCGKRASSGDRFCRICGSQLRV